MRQRRLLLIIIIAFSVTLFFAVCEGATSYIAIYGDSRLNSDIHAKIVEEIMKYKPQAVFHTGDLVTGNREEWKIFNKITKKMRRKTSFYPAIGNHEYYAGLNSYLDNFKLPNNEQWYSVDRLGIHFIILNSMARIHKGSAQYTWLEDDLRNIGDNVKYIVVIFHHPPFGSHYGAVGKFKPLRTDLVPLLKKYGVDIVFNGHTHAYERCYYNGVYYVTTGGGGADLHHQTRTSPQSQKFIPTHHFILLHYMGDVLVVEARDIDSNIIDAFRIRPKLYTTPLTQGVPLPVD